MLTLIKKIFRKDTAILSVVVIVAVCLLTLHTWWQLLLRDSRDKYQYNFLGAAVLFTTLSVNLEMDEMFRAFSMSSRAGQSPEGQILDRYRQWKEPRQDSQLIQSIHFVLQEQTGEQSVRKLNLESNEWEKRPLPDTITAAADPDAPLVSSTPVYHSRRTMRIDSSDFSIHIPMDVEAAPEAEGWIVIQLDIPYIINGLYVQTMRKQLQDWGFEKDSIDLIVFKNLQQESVLYRSKPHLELDDFDGVIASMLLSAPRTGTMSTNDTSGNPIYNNNGVHHIKVLVSKTDGFIYADIWADTYRDLIIGYLVIIALGTSVFYFILVARRKKEMAEQQINYVATVSHELLTPLSVIRSAGSNMSRSLVRDEKHIQRYGKMITKESKRLSALLTNSLMYARLTNKNSNKDFELLDIEELVTSAIDEAVIASGNSGERFRLNSPHEHFTVEGNKEALQAALMNLLQNAEKYSEHEAPVDIHIHATDPDRVSIEVMDEGIGLEGENIERLFEPFYRGNNVAGISAKGTGIGLSLVKQIMLNHNGEVHARSRRLGGAVFTLVIPIQERTEKNERHPQNLVS